MAGDSALSIDRRLCLYELNLSRYNATEQTLSLLLYPPSGRYAPLPEDGTV